MICVHTMHCRQVYLRQLLAAASASVVVPDFEGNLFLALSTIAQLCGRDDGADACARIVVLNRPLLQRLVQAPAVDASTFSSRTEAVLSLLVNAVNRVVVRLPHVVLTFRFLSLHCRVCCPVSWTGFGSASRAKR